MALSLARASAQIQAYVDFLHQYNRLPPRSLKRFEDRPARRALAQTVREGKRPRLAGHEFSAVRFRSVSGESAEAVLGIDRRLRPARPLRAFVGHRFTPEVTNNLRHNLQLLCRPYGVSLWYSDTDMPNGSVFETIV
jgi:hypothetical protein